MAGFGGGTLDATVANLTVTSLTDGTATLTGGTFTGLTDVTSTNVGASDVTITNQLKLDGGGIWIVGEDQYGNEINVLRLDDNGYVDIGTILKIGALYHESDTGLATVINMPVTGASTYGTDIGFQAVVGGTTMIKAYADADGAGGVLNEQVVVKDLFVSNGAYSQTSVSADTTFTSVIKAKHLLEGILFYNTTANASILDLGTTAGGNDVFINKTIAASTYTYLDASDLSMHFFSTSVDTTLYLNDDDGSSDWNSGSFTVYFITKKIIE